jgi:hypothetical protein
MKKILILTFGFTTLFAQKKEETKTAETPIIKKETKLKDYNSLITQDTKNSIGLFKVHKNQDKYLYEIPNNLLKRDMLLTTRFSGVPSGLGGDFINAGSEMNSQLIYWERFQDKILIKVKTVNNIADDNLPINLSVKANNVHPTLFAFEIQSYSKDSSAVVIDVTKFFGTDIKGISAMTPNLRKEYEVKSLDESRSFIQSIKCFSENIEVKQDFTYVAGKPTVQTQTESITVQVNQSMVLLPEKPMQPRIFDSRVGYYTVNQIDYGSDELKSHSKTYIRRWRLEPKDESAYFRGELVEPKKPIVYYLDPATPDNLKKYMKEGVELWQKAFETAGFKNAIICKYAPTKEEDPDFDPEDVRYNMVRYVASTTRNAVGPSTEDPRSGEIIESDIIWYHNHLRSYRNRYLIETGAANPSARTLNTPEAEIGEMMKMVIAHEIGHALGFPHNMSASCSYNPEDYRKPAFTKINGISASIMDYARFNYIAQPGDKDVRFVRQMGPYDSYAVNWGYRVIPNAKSPEDEVPTLNKWIEEKAGNAIYEFGEQNQNYDPYSQTEDISNNAIIASTYGVKNLKFVLQNLDQWTSEKTNSYDDLAELYSELIGIYTRYVNHVVTYIGGVHELQKKPNQEGNVFNRLTKAKQKEAMNWLSENFINNTDWLINNKYLQKIKASNYNQELLNAQNRIITNLLSLDRLNRLIDGTMNDNLQYGAIEFLADVKRSVFKNSSQKPSNGTLTRNLQRAFVERMLFILTDEHKTATFNVNLSDIKAFVRGELTSLKAELNTSKNIVQDKETKYHYTDLVKRIEVVFENK